MIGFLLDWALNVVSWLIWAPAMWVFFQMRKASRSYKKLWRGALELMAKTQEENEILRARADDVHRLNADLVAVIDEAEERYRAVLTSTREMVESERKAHEATKTTLERATEFVNEFRAERRNEHHEKLEADAARKALMRKRPPGGAWARNVDQIIKEVFR